MDTTDKMFETASRLKLRFPFKGQISAEDLWDLPVEALDSIFKTLNSQVKQANEESLLAPRAKADDVLAVRVAIVRHIVGVKLEEAETRRLEVETREKKQRIMAIINAKKDEALQGKSIDELSRMLNDL